MNDVNSANDSSPSFRDIEIGTALISILGVVSFVCQCWKLSLPMYVNGLGLGPRKVLSAYTLLKTGKIPSNNKTQLLKYYKFKSSLGQKQLEKPIAIRPIELIQR